MAMSTTVSEAPSMKESYPSVVDTARTYYNSSDADQFYYHVWGGEDIHIGLYAQESGESIFEASRKTVEAMVKQLQTLPQTNGKVIDIGAGYGGSARFLAKSGYSVSCLNISEEQNIRNRNYNSEQGLDSKIEVIDGSFEDLPFRDTSFDIAWSQDAILHSGDREKVLTEVYRVLKSGGEFIFTDPMQSPNASKEHLQAVLDRIHLDSMGSYDYYEKIAEKIGFEKLTVIDLSQNLVFHYSHILAEINERYEEIQRVCSKAYLEKMKTGLKHWIEAGKKEQLNWGILHFRKK
ncbi:MAG: methyltransferase domain-containing protein [Spirochaetota bacterium]